MKRCPTCNREFPDKYRFCQYDRIALVEVPSFDESPQADQTSLASQLDSLTESATKAAVQVRQRLADKDVLGWMKSHVVLLSGIAGSIVVLFILYHAFIKAQPDEDGNKAALAYKECKTNYQAKVEAGHRTFLSEFTGRGYQSRADAEVRLESLLSTERGTYNKCIETADKQYAELIARYSDDVDGQAEFSTAFNAIGQRKSADEIEGASPLLAAVNEKLGSIRAPFPDSNRIINDLVGKRMDGWSFEYTSEFKNVNIVSSRFDGPMLMLRTHLDLEGYIVKEPSFAVLEMTYLLNDNGEWEYQTFTELLYTKPVVDYFIGDEIFLIGKWRWEGNYATYNADGTWNGQWDNGVESNGNWRIINGNLVVTRDGNNWVNAKIAKFTKTELIVGENPSSRAERVE